MLSITIAEPQSVRLQRRNTSIAQISFEGALKALSKREGPDVYYSTGVPPSAKIFGKPLSNEIMKSGEIDLITQDIMEEVQKEKLSEVPEMNLAVSRWAVAAKSGPLTHRKTC